MSGNEPKTTVIRNGTLIDGKGGPARRNDAIVMQGNQIKSLGPLPPDISLEDHRIVTVIDAAGQWIMSGLIDAHCQSPTATRSSKAKAKAADTGPELVRCKNYVSGTLRPMTMSASTVALGRRADMTSTWQILTRRQHQSGGRKVGT